jgi:hypothetical protein
LFDSQTLVSPGKQEQPPEWSLISSAVMMATSPSNQLVVGERLGPWQEKLQGGCHSCLVVVDPLTWPRALSFPWHAATSLYCCLRSKRFANFPFLFHLILILTGLPKILFHSHGLCAFACGSRGLSAVAPTILRTPRENCTFSFTFYPFQSPTLSTFFRGSYSLVMHG